MDTRVSFDAAQLTRLGMLSCKGDEARAFLHAQLTNDLLDLPPGQARHAGWCSAKGRLLATVLVIPHEQGFLLQLSRDIAAAVARRLALFVLRAKAKVVDDSDAWVQLGIWGPGAEAQLAALALPVPAAPLAVAAAGNARVVRLGSQRFLVAAPAADRERFGGAIPDAGDEAWALEEIRAGRPQVVLATQDQFVPQMVNLERLGGVDFKKGCYPGQEIVARTQYRGVLKRRMVRARVGAQAAAGNDLHAADMPGQACGTVVNAARVAGDGSELLAVVQIASLESGGILRLGAVDGPPLEILPLPYAA